MTQPIRRKRSRQDKNPSAKPALSITLGQVNREIDRQLHHYFHRGPLPVLLDSALHAMVEQDPKTSLEKFLIFNAGPLLRESLKLFRANKRKRR
jgi:hypothetical protein